MLVNTRNIVTKAHEKGLSWLFRRTFNESYKLIKRPLGFLRWAFPLLGKLMSSTQLGDRRLLIIYDFSSQPLSIGDILLFQEASLVLREEYQLKMVDFAMVYNPERPTSSKLGDFSISEENFTYQLASVLPVAQVNQYIGSIFVFNSHLHLQRFIADNANFYHVWPSAWQFAKQKYLLYKIVNDLLYNYYKKHGTIPYLSCRQFMIDWAQTFYHEKVYPLIPVTVQVRNNKAFSTHRNLKLECWLEFFRYCEEHYPVKFVVVCSLAEVDDRMRQCHNVIIAKDHYTNIEQDLALIQTSAIHMGASSGPGTLALFSSKPYLLANTDLISYVLSYRDIIQEDGFLRFYFSNPLQRFSIGPETTPLLVTEFARMWESVDVNGWWSFTDNRSKVESKPLTWLR